ncbi:hypothetical protein LJB89_02160 [Tyzzerella sp. OttesenSCG-928-J15]|nr:hypothetical protein [Tyzzerella sp. OttesenSCG-928-J15]
MDEFFNKNYDIDYMFINEDLTSSFITIASKTQETSLLHSLKCGYPMEWFVKEQCGFVLTGWNCEILSYPKWAETINIATWPTKFQNMLAHRSFLGRNMDGETIFKTDSDWVLMSLKDKKPLRIPQEMYDRYAPTGEPVIGEKIRIPQCDDYDFIARQDILVTRQYIDSNHHVNNISYIVWAMDIIPADYYSQCEPAKIMVKYNKESRLGDELYSEVYRKENKFYVCIKSKLNDEIRCTLHMEWRNKAISD